MYKFKSENVDPEFIYIYGKLKHPPFLFNP